MLKIPHDYYLRFTDEKVLDETIAFHNKGTYTLHSSTDHFARLHSLPEALLTTLTGNELTLYPDLEITLDRPSMPGLEGDHPLSRAPSATMFTDNIIPFETLEQLFSGLLQKNSESYHRGYPSGGALYPVEVFCCLLSTDRSAWPCNEHVLHLLPSSKRFERVSNSSTQKHLKQALLHNANIGNPYCAVVYAAYLPKTTFKYRYRGYRLAAMETGSMYAHLDLRAKELKLINRVRSGYTDHMLVKALGLNPALFPTLCVQFFGNDHEPD